MLSLVKRTKNNTPSTKNCIYLTLEEERSLFSLKRNKQLLSNFEDWNFKQFKQLEGWDIVVNLPRKSVHEKNKGTFNSSWCIVKNA